MSGSTKVSLRTPFSVTMSRLGGGVSPATSFISSSLVSPVSSRVEVFTPMEKILQKLVRNQSLTSIEEVCVVLYDKTKDLNMPVEPQAIWKYFQNNDHARKVEELDLRRLKLINFPRFLCALKFIQKLDLSDNVLTKFPVNELAYFPRLKVLIIKNNKLSRLPSDLSIFERCDHIDLSGNPLNDKDRIRIKLVTGQLLTLVEEIWICLSDNLKDKTLPTDLEGMNEYFSKAKNIKEITKLDLRGLRLTTIPKFLFKLISLEELDLSENCFERFPLEELLVFTSLKILRMTKNKIYCFPDGLEKLTGLKELYLDRNHITSVEGLSKIVSLECLSLSENPLDTFLLGGDISLCLGSMPSLKKLFLKNTSIKAFSRLGEFHALEELDCSRNEIENLPEGLTLIRLKWVNFEGNSLHKIPLWLTNNRGLTYLNFSCNLIINIPDELFEKLNLLEILQLNNNCIYFLPAQVGTLRSLKKLLIKKNYISSLPKEFEHLQALQTLDLSDNQIREFPLILYSLKRLGVLSLKNNQLALLPEGIARLKFLRVLEVDGNQLTEFPSDFKELLLRVLSVSKNLFKGFPEVICSFKTLLVLKYNGNGLLKMPERISNMESLRYLEVENNLLSTLSEELLLLNLEGLSIGENPFIDPTLELEKIRSFKQLKKVSLRSLGSTLKLGFREVPDGFSKQLIEFDLSSNVRLRRLPEDLGRYTKLKTLDLTGAIVQDLPPGCEKLSNLKRLIWSGNCIQTFPVIICRMFSLETLDLSSNWIAELPQAFSELRNLRHLKLSGNSFEKEGLSPLQGMSITHLDLSINAFEELPQWIQTLPLRKLNLMGKGIKKLNPLPRTLRELTITNTSIKSFEVLTELRNLRYLRLNYNHIEQFPPVSQMQFLRHLSLGSNDIREIPYYLVKMPSLVFLELMKNPLAEVPNTLRTKQGLTLWEDSFKKRQTEALPSLPLISDTRDTSYHPREFHSYSELDSQNLDESRWQLFRFNEGKHAML